MKKLPTVTLLGIDCVDVDRLILATEICQKEFVFADVKILSSIERKNPATIHIAPITTVEDYSRFVIIELASYVETSHVLIVQHDGFILNPKAWDDDFLQYDYIGAPILVKSWAIEKLDFPETLRDMRVVGNGGFSLRSKKLLDMCTLLAGQGIFEKYHPEDVVLSVHHREFLEMQGITFAPLEVAKQFSFEAEHGDERMWNNQFGFHGLRRTDISRWSDLHSEYTVDRTQGTIVKSA